MIFLEVIENTVLPIFKSTSTVSIRRVKALVFN